ncbi:hypothetical protein BU24DRAFT_463351 [Aaosphaeria arxii CBS 175.79]|uniref:Uncharacterized protein n=1 Tax=Aaosphaeria arxii CBS 175.79 TaxID=1450172 RepID=A0A6A5XP81_9PLEO|nr:uncharacterized protein BU24DRAFT_463351 [Aaosphaeria arxii CBS 175.79]KAF2014571.1 hypothetical protein BU24DRAFT_463351 [Aaosphaeria arxii CBS 175.79]
MSSSVCPVVGTTNDVLPPNHPEVDLAKDGQTCPVVGATTDHHHNLHKHPAVPIEGSSPTATACPALKTVVNQPKSKAMDDEVCPVIGPATTVLPPDHPSTADAKEGDVCPVTKATIAHHKNKVHSHPSVQGAEAGAVCPVAGVRI